MKLRLPSKLVAAILAAAAPVLFSTLSTATMGAAAVAVLVGESAAAFDGPSGVTYTYHKTADGTHTTITDFEGDTDVYVTGTGDNDVTLTANNTTNLKVTSAATNSMFNIGAVQAKSVWFSQGRFAIDSAKGNVDVFGNAGTIYACGSQLWFTGSADYTGANAISNSVVLGNGSFNEGIERLDYSALRLGRSTELSGEVTVLDESTKISFQDSGTVLTLSGVLKGSGNIYLSRYNGNGKLLITGTTDNYEGTVFLTNIGSGGSAVEFGGGTEEAPKTINFNGVVSVANTALTVGSHTTLNLTGVSALSGTTTVNADAALKVSGVVRLSNTLTNNGAVTVADGGALDLRMNAAADNGTAVAYRTIHADGTYTDVDYSESATTNGYIVKEGMTMTAVSGNGVNVEQGGTLLLNGFAYEGGSFNGTTLSNVKGISNSTYYINSAGDVALSAADTATVVRLNGTAASAASTTNLTISGLGDAATPVLMERSTYTNNSTAVFNVTLNDGAYIDLGSRSDGNAVVNGTLTINGGATAVARTGDALGYNSSTAMKKIIIGSTDADKTATLFLGERQTMTTSIQMTGNALIAPSEIRDVRVVGLESYDGTISASGNNNIISADIMLRNSLTMNVALGSSLDVTGRVWERSGGAKLTKTGLGTLTLNNKSNTNAHEPKHGLDIQGGTVNLDSNTVIAATSNNLSLSNGSQLNVRNGAEVTVNRGITLSGNSTIAIEDGSSLTTANAAAITINSGLFQNNGTLNIAGATVNIVTSTAAATNGSLYGTALENVQLHGNGYLATPNEGYSVYGIVSGNALTAEQYNNVTWQINGAAAEGYTFDGNTLTKGTLTSVELGTTYFVTNADGSYSAGNKTDYDRAQKIHVLAGGKLTVSDTLPASSQLSGGGIQVDNGGSVLVTSNQTNNAATTINGVLELSEGVTYTMNVKPTVSSTTSFVLGENSVLDLSSQGYSPNGGTNQPLRYLLLAGHGDGLVKLKTTGGWFRMGSDDCLDANYSITGPIEIDGGKLTINAGKTLTVDNKFQLEGATNVAGAQLVVQGKLAVQGTNAYVLLGNKNSGSAGHPGYMTIEGGETVVTYFKNAYSADTSSITLTKGGSLQITSDNMFAARAESDTGPNAGAIVNINDGKLIAEGNDWTLNHTANVGTMAVLGANSVTTGGAVTLQQGGAEISVGSATKEGHLVLNSALNGSMHVSVAGNSTLGLGTDIDVSALTNSSVTGNGTVLLNLDVEENYSLNDTDGFRDTYLDLSAYQDKVSFADTLQWNNKGVALQDTTLTDDYHLIDSTSSDLAHFYVNTVVSAADYTAQRTSHGVDSAALVGEGTFTMTEWTLPTGASISDPAWTGTVRVTRSLVDNPTSSTMGDGRLDDKINALANSNSRVELNGVSGWLGGNVSAALVLTGQGENGTGTALQIVNGGSGNERQFTGTVSGKGDVEYAWNGGTTNTTQTTTFTGNVSNWTGSFRATNPNGQLVALQFKANATEINADVKQEGGKDLTVTFSNTNDVVMNGDISKGSGAAAALKLVSDAPLTITGNVAADQLIINGGKSATFNAADGKQQSIGVLSGSGALNVTGTAATETATATGGLLHITGERDNYSGVVTLSNTQTADAVGLVVEHSDVIQSSVVNFASGSGWNDTTYASSLLAFRDAEGNAIDGTVAGLAGNRGHVVAKTLTINVASGTQAFLNRYDGEKNRGTNTNDRAVLEVNKLVKTGAGTQEIGGEYTVAKGFTAAGLVIENGIEVQQGTLHLKTRGAVTADMTVSAGATLKTTDSQANAVTSAAALQYNGGITLNGTAESTATLDYEDGSTYFTEGLTASGEVKIINRWAKQQYVKSLAGENVTLTIDRTNSDGNKGGYVNVMGTSETGFSGTIKLIARENDLGGGLVMHDAPAALDNTVVDFSGVTNAQGIINTYDALLAFIAGDGTFDSSNKLADTNTFTAGAVAGLVGTKGDVKAGALTINTANGGNYNYGGALHVSSLTKTGAGSQTISGTGAFTATAATVTEGSLILNHTDEAITLNTLTITGGALYYGGGSTLSATMADSKKQDTSAAGNITATDGTISLSGADSTLLELGASGANAVVNVANNLDIEQIRLQRGGTVNITDESTVTAKKLWVEESSSSAVGGTINLSDSAKLDVTMTGAWGFQMAEGKSINVADEAEFTLNSANGETLVITAKDAQQSAVIGATALVKQYTTGSADMQISHADMEVSKTDTAWTLGHQLTDTNVTNTGSGKVTLSYEGNTLGNLHAKDGDITVGASMTAAGFAKADDGKTIGIAENETLTVAGKTAITGKTTDGAALNSVTVNAAGISKTEGASSATISHANITVGTAPAEQGLLALADAVSYDIADVNLVDTNVVSYEQMTVSNVALDAASSITARDGSTLEGSNRLTLSAGEGIKNGVTVESSQLSGLTLTGDSNLTLDLSAHGYAPGATDKSIFRIELSDFSWEELAGATAGTVYSDSKDINEVFKVLALGTTDTFYKVLSVTQGVGTGFVNPGITLEVQVPEPTTSVLSLLALAGMSARRRRK